MSFSSQSAPAKDPRPIRDKNFQLTCIKQLIDFLSKTGFDKPISAKILTAPSSKDFQMIFKYLYGKIDVSYEFGKKFEDEVPVLIKGIRYPYANDISKSQLYAVGKHARLALAFSPAHLDGGAHRGTNDRQF